jgi:predicted nuclease of restriction endonuclease-like RecB superfamily
MCRDWLFVLSDCGRMTGHSEVTRSISEQGALFRINVENRDYHYLSQFEIDGGKRIYQQLSKYGASAPEYLFRS